MANRKLLGTLERRVMDHLWSVSEPQTVRDVHAAMSAGSTRNTLAYTTIMTVLRRLTDKELVRQDRADRAHRYAAARGREELVADLMVDALEQAADSGDRRAALMHFLERVGSQDLDALQRALSELEIDRVVT